MTKKMNVLIIEDEPLMIDNYVRALEVISSKNSSYAFQIASANDCDSANLLIEQSLTGIPFDLVFLDIRIKPSENKKLLSGEDIGVMLRSSCAKVKIIVGTMHSSNYRLVNIFKSMNPEGLLIKSELNFSILIKSIEKVLFEVPTYTKSVLKLVRQHMSNDILIDCVDRQLLYHLSEGARTKDLPNILPLTLRGVEKRKHRLKQAFGTKSNSDRDLIRTAKVLGFL